VADIDAGVIQSCQRFGAGLSSSPLAAYGSTKAASHYVVSEIHSEHGKNVTAWVFHPGLVDTQMGRRFSEVSGYPLFTVQQCVDMFLEQVRSS
jgi:norsolorinic acid ketoreductase